MMRQLVFLVRQITAMSSTINKCLPDKMVDAVFIIPVELVKRIHTTTEICGIAPCASSLWLREQRRAEISKQELLDQNADFDETLYVDGDCIKKGWKNKFETLMGREITEKERKKMRYKSVYIITTK